MTVLRHAAERADGATFTELLEALDIPKSTLHRLLHTLLSERLLRLDETDHRYKLGYGIFELARHAWERTDIRREAQHAILELVRHTGETVHLAILDGLDVVYVDKIEGSHTIRMASTVGARNPAYCTGVGKALLAFVDSKELARRFTGYEFRSFTPNTITSFKRLANEMARIRAAHFAVDNEEHEVGIRCAAAPIFN
ncbi:MAG TPA: IclR family transcriptional regulator, partial [Bauldia sp.]|nr:IclR family transcriptional regulator [Bauldia sp.]